MLKIGTMESAYCFKYGFEYTFFILKLTWSSFMSLFKGMNLNSLSGPVGIYSTVSEAASLGPEYYFQLMAMISVNVGVEGKIFGSVSSKQVARALLQRHKIKVDRRKFLDNGPYTHLGVNNVRVELFKDVVATIQVVLKEKK